MALLHPSTSLYRTTLLTCRYSSRSRRANHFAGSGAVSRIVYQARDASTNKTKGAPSDAEEQPDFRGQIWGSTYQRIQRERVEKEKYNTMQTMGHSRASRIAQYVGRMFPNSPLF